MAGLNLQNNDEEDEWNQNNNENERNEVQSTESSLQQCVVMIGDTLRDFMDNVKLDLQRTSKKLNEDQSLCYQLLEKIFKKIDNGFKVLSKDQQRISCEVVKILSMYSNSLATCQIKVTPLKSINNTNVIEKNKSTNAIVDLTKSNSGLNYKIPKRPSSHSTSNKKVNENTISTSKSTNITGSSKTSNAAPGNLF